MSQLTRVMNSAGGNFTPEIAALLARNSGPEGSLLPTFNFTPDEAALLQRTAEVPKAELEKDRRRLIAANADAYGYDIYKAVQAGAVEGMQSQTGFLNTIRVRAAEDSSIPWWTRVLTWNRSDLMHDAQNTDSPTTPGDKDLPQMDQDSMSLPFQIVHAGGVDPSTVAQSQAAGMPIDANFAREGGKSIGRLLNKNALGTGTASTKYFGTLSNYGIYDNPNVATGTLHAAWDALATPYKILTDVSKMKNALVQLGFPDDGPYVLTVGPDYALVLDAAMNPGQNTTTIRDALKGVMGISDVVADAYAPSAKVSLTYVGAVRPIKQLDITVVPYGGYNGSDWGTQNWVIFAAMNIQHRVDFNGNFGVAVYSE